MERLQCVAEACWPSPPLADVPFLIVDAPLHQAFADLCKAHIACAYLPPPALFFLVNLQLPSGLLAVKAPACDWL